MNNKRILLSLVIALSLMIFLYPQTVHASSCADCEGDGYVVEYTSGYFKCELCDGEGQFYQEPITSEIPCDNADCDNGTVYIYTDCAECGADGKLECSQCGETGFVQVPAKYGYVPCDVCGGEKYWEDYIDCDNCVDGIRDGYVECLNCTMVMDWEYYVNNGFMCDCSFSDVTDASCDNCMGSGKKLEYYECNNCDIDGEIYVKIEDEYTAECGGCGGWGYNDCYCCYESSGQIVNGTLCQRCGGDTVVEVTEEGYYYDCEYCDDGLMLKNYGKEVICNTCHGTGSITDDNTDSGSSGDSGSGSDSGSSGDSGSGSGSGSSGDSGSGSGSGSSGDSGSGSDSGSSGDSDNDGVCDTCGGDGVYIEYTSGYFKCELCDGEGRFYQEAITTETPCDNPDCNNGTVYIRTACAECGTSGIVTCLECNGLGYIDDGDTYPTCSDCVGSGEISCYCCYNSSGYIVNGTLCQRCGGDTVIEVTEGGYYYDCEYCDDGLMLKNYGKEVQCPYCHGSGSDSGSSGDSGSGSGSGSSGDSGSGSGSGSSGDSGSGSGSGSSGDSGSSSGSGSSGDSGSGSGSGSSSGSGSGSDGSFIVYSGFNKYCMDSGMGAFPWYSDDYLYFYWYYSELNAYMLYSFPKDIISDMPIWYQTDCSSGSPIQIFVDWSNVNNFVGYMYKNGSWSENITAGNRGLEEAPSILYSDADIYKLENGQYTMVYDGAYNFSGGSGDAPDEEEEEKNLLERIISTIASLPSVLYKGFTNVFNTLFVPTYNPMTELLNLLKSKVPIATQMYAFIYNFIDYCNNYDYTNYSVNIPLNFNGAFGIEDSYNIFDMSWYQPYRDIVNGILSAFIWLGFAFSAYKRIPKMIGGI